MAIALPTFTPLEDSLWLTLCARALDNRSPHPILGDAMADEIVRTLDYDYGQLHIDTNLFPAVAGQGDPAQPGTGGRPVPTGLAPVPPAGRPPHRLVADGNHRPALPLLTSAAPEHAASRPR